MLLYDVWGSSVLSDFVGLCLECPALGSCYRLLQETGSGLFWTADWSGSVLTELPILRPGFFRYTYTHSMFFLSSDMRLKVLRWDLSFFLCSVCVQILRRQCLLLPVLPSRSQYSAETEIPEGSPAIPYQKDRIWGRHEDQVHQRWGGGDTLANPVLRLLWSTLPLTSICWVLWFPLCRKRVITQTWNLLYNA